MILLIGEVGGNDTSYSTVIIRARLPQSELIHLEHDPQACNLGTKMILITAIATILFGFDSHNPFGKKFLVKVRVLCKKMPLICKIWSEYLYKWRLLLLCIYNFTVIRNSNTITLFSGTKRRWRWKLWSIVSTNSFSLQESNVEV